MRLGLDIDGTIAAAPAFFRRVALAWRAIGRRVHVISSRSDTPEVRRESETELVASGRSHDGLHLLPSIAAGQSGCPHQDLDWYARRFHLEVAIAQALRVSVFFDDDEKVLRLFREFAPWIILASSLGPGQERRNRAEAGHRVRHIFCSLRGARVLHATAYVA